MWLPESGERGETLPLERCLASEREARTFLRDAFPPTWDPFVRDYIHLKLVKGFWRRNIILGLGNGKPGELVSDNKYLSVSMPLTKLFAAITAADLTPPPMPVPQQRVIGMTELTRLLRERWERQSPAMTRE